MWVELRIAQFSGNAFLEALGYEVFQAFGFIMQFLNGVVQYLVEKGLDQSMVPNDLKSAFSASSRKADTIVSLIVDKSRLDRCQLLDHVCHRGG